jgi:hypothetical protein
MEGGIKAPFFSMLEKTRYWTVIQALRQLNEPQMWRVVLDYALLVKIAEWNRQQLQEGEKADGTGLPDYSRTSVEIYGKEPGAIKLFDTGAFYESIEAVIVDDVIAIVSNPIKRDEITGRITNLKEKYGNEIIGISDEHMEELRAQVKAKIVQYIYSLLRTR